MLLLIFKNFIKDLNFLSFKTKYFPYNSLSKDWYILNAEGIYLGRLASEVVKRIIGKYNPFYSPNINCGDNVIVINANKIQLTGKKWNNKKYISFSGYPGGQKKIIASHLFKKNPKQVIEKAIKGMLPKNRLKNKFLKNLYIYNDSNHTHSAQNPKLLKIEKNLIIK